jgi:hypothetical protein
MYNGLVSRQTFSRICTNFLNTARNAIAGMALLIALQSSAQTKSENLIIVTLDGMRWQEIFKGADKDLLNNKTFTPDSADAFKTFWANDELERRKKLFPFLWGTIANNGCLYGNRAYNCNVNNANPYWFSYPGYNEIFTGYPDTSVNSNDKIWNNNTNVLEFINRQNAYKNKVAAFTTWDVFPYILNTKRSGLYVNADVDSLKFNTNTFKLINDWQFLTPKPIGVRPDVITYIAAREYLKEYKPKVLYIAFDETDDLAHAGMYNLYLQSARAEDKMLEDLWNYLQSNPSYKNKTTLFITCDHGRGDKVKETWKHHGQKVEDCNQIWFAAIGPSITPTGEVKNEMQLYQKQFAATFANILGLQFTANHPIAAALPKL